MNQPGSAGEENMRRDPNLEKVGGVENRDQNTLAVHDGSRHDVRLSKPIGRIFPAVPLRWYKDTEKSDIDCWKR